MSLPHKSEPIERPGRLFTAEDAADLVRGFPRALARAEADRRALPSLWVRLKEAVWSWHLQWVAPTLASVAALLYLGAGPAPAVSAALQVTAMATALGRESRPGSAAEDQPALVGGQGPVPDELSAHPSQRVALAFQPARFYLGPLRARLIIHSRADDRWSVRDVALERRGGGLVYQGPLRDLVGGLTPGHYQIYPITDRPWRLPDNAAASARAETAATRWALHLLPDLL